MTRKDLVEEMKRRISATGIPDHCCSVKVVPAFVEATAIIGGQVHTIRLAGGATSNDLDREIGRLRHVYRTCVVNGQMDLEDAL